MKRNALLTHLTAFLLVLSLAAAVGAVTAFAEPWDEQEQPGGYIEETPQENLPEQQAQENLPEQQPAEQPQDTPETPQEEPQEEPLNQWYDYIGSYEEDANTYEAPENLGDLPQAAPEQVVEATAVPMPIVAVSDASLFSGIVTWLCVALGIAVVVGVLVSKRTRRRGV